MSAPLALIEDGPLAGTRIVTLRGEVDVGGTPALREWLSRASDGGRRSLAVDLSHVEFLAVSGLYVLADEQARMARHQARLTVICSAPRFLHLFDVCRLDGVLHVVPSRSALGGHGWDPADESRAERLVTWLERYQSGAAPPDAGAETRDDAPEEAPPPSAS